MGDRFEFRPVLDRVLISPEELPRESKGGVYIPDNVRQTGYRGFVVKCGPDVHSVKEGDYVYYDPNGCGCVELSGEFFHVARDIAEGAISMVAELPVIFEDDIK